MDEKKGRISCNAHLHGAICDVMQYGRDGVFFSDAAAVFEEELAVLGPVAAWRCRS